MALLMCLFMALSLMPLSALAEGEDASGSADGIELSKTVSVPDEDGVYWLDLEAYTTGTVTMSTSNKTADIVILLDQSGSMADGFGSSTRQQALKDAVKNFISDVAGKYSEETDYRIGIVTFGSNASVLSPMTYVDEAGKNALIGGVDGLPNSPSGATRVDKGMEAVDSLLPAADTERDRIVIVFTDGVPTTSSDFDTGVADSAIATAKSLKDAGVQIYTVGIFNGTDTSELYGEKFDYELLDDVPCDGSVGSVWGASWVAAMFSNDFRDIDIPAGNRFLNYLSSNSGDASQIGILSGTYHPEHTGIAGGDGWKITSNATCDTTAGYYLAAGSASELSNVFTTISNLITMPTVSLDANTTVRDLIAEPFELAVDATHSISVSKVCYTGSDTWAAAGTDITGSVTIDVSTTGTVDVKGFDFDANVVYDDASVSPAFGGSKLVIKIPVKLKANAVLPDGVSAGSVPTNGSASGVYADGETDPVDTFTSPSVTLYTVTFEDWDDTVLKTEIVVPGSGATAPSDPTRAGYDFDHWDTDFSAVSGDLTVKAVYEKDDSDTKTISYTVKYYKDGVEQTADQGGGSAEIWAGDSSAALSFTPAADKYEGYKLDETATVIPATFSDGDVISVYYVSESSATCTVTFKSGAHSTIDGGTDDVVVSDVAPGTAWDDSWVPETAADTGYKISSPAWDESFPESITEDLVFTLQDEAVSSPGPGTVVPVEPAGDTDDLDLDREDHYAYIVGYPDGTVRPEDSITRAEVATIFYRMLTDTSRQTYWSQTNSFSDVSADDWYNNAVSTLANAGVISGYPDGEFKPDEPITRAEFAAIAARFYETAETSATDAFTDISESWAREYINQASALDLVSGYSDGTFRPDEDISRAEAIELMNNVLGRSPDKDHLLEGMKTWSDNMDTTAWYYAAIQEATNSHEYEIPEGETYEVWTELQTERDWSALEKEWSNAYSGT